MKVYIKKNAEVYCQRVPAVGWYDRMDKYLGTVIEVKKIEGIAYTAYRGGGYAWNSHMIVIGWEIFYKSI